jgi:uncharacterized protein YlxP (DUF503 family)
MIVGIGKLDLFLPESTSLKEKRQRVRRIVERAKQRFNVSIMEVDRNNLWQKAHIGFSVVGERREEIERIMQEIEEFVESFYFGDIVSSEKEILVLGDGI